MKANRIILSSVLIAVPVFIAIVAFYPAYRDQALAQAKLPEEAKPVSGLTAQGDTFDLAKYKGKIVFLNFWASWSKVSRNENRNIVRAWQKLKDNPKIVFVSISLDTDATAWKTAIAEDELSWPNQLCDFKKWASEPVKTYNVKTLPANFLIDGKGMVIAQNLKDTELETKIGEAAN